ncbi:sugar ABC transporter ATP-binding protein [Priestia megaterium]|nr:sugar ABC transporter ATP-binding protein [Priestia megaterium]
MTLSMNKISQSFGSFQALKEMDFSVAKGEIHALLGANGAGKSTLMKILCGAYDDYKGTISKDGDVIAIHSPQDAKRAGISIVHQEVDVALIPSLSVAENILLDIQTTKGSPSVIKWRTLYNKAEEALHLLGSTLSVKKNVADLTLSEKQQVLLARAIIQKAEYIILDEPTAPLSEGETKQLFHVIQKLKQSGVGIIYISHRLQEVFELCDRYTVLRDGQYITTNHIYGSVIEEVISFMLGEAFKEEFPKEAVPVGQKLLEVKDVSLENTLSKISFHVKKGEVVGIAGLVGAGKTELCRSLFGLEYHAEGEMTLKGEKLLLNKQPYYYIEKGLSLIPEERRKEGIIVEESISENLILPSLTNFTKWSFLQREKQQKKAVQMVKEVGIKTSSIQQAVGTLSGGNQQKVAIGKWLLKDTDVYIFDEPTKGIDIGSKREIFELMNRLVKQQKGILYATCEFSELLGIADRIYVMYDGRIVKELTREEATQETIFYYATGGVN